MPASDKIPERHSSGLRSLANAGVWGGGAHVNSTCPSLMASGGSRSSIIIALRRWHRQCIGTMEMRPPRCHRNLPAHHAIDHESSTELDPTW